MINVIQSISSTIHVFLQTIKNIFGIGDGGIHKTATNVVARDNRGGFSVPVQPEDISAVLHKLSNAGLTDLILGTKNGAVKEIALNELAKRPDLTPEEHTLIISSGRIRKEL